jgi:uncharacterized protein
MIAMNVAQLLLSPHGSTRRFSFEEEAASLAEPSVVAPVRGDCTLMRTGHGILADCRFETALSQECARCLEPATSQVSGRLQEEFLPTVDVRTGSPLPGELDADAFPISEDHVVNLGEAIRQHVLMAAPLRPLCRPDCEGLCPDCGQNLNEQRCACAPAGEDSPFNTLKQLLDATGEAAPSAAPRSSRRNDGRRSQA